MPGVGFLLGGVIAAVLTPRASFLTAGIGVISVLALATPALARARWGEQRHASPGVQDEPASQTAGVGPGP
jgi:O-antigen/teichoic acid export membrane protein